ncbi:LysR family transcriptional regulator [Propionicicella superfundia]|uniref:LysR family transcriptional regulator n=1 Tax=Propionicicella superfundia TaxID=348582 RepID=UPI0004082088|nr:LysR family transcriptional regulator [Propionicicella superfundia]
MNLHRLRLLRELHLRGTIAAVAEALCYSPSAISQQLALLEREAGIALLRPAGRRLQLTHAGEILVGHAGTLLSQVEIAEADLARSRGEVGGTLRTAAFQTATMTLIPSVLDRLYEQHPQLTVLVSEIQPDGALSALAAHDFDVVLCEEYPGVPLPRDANVHREELAQDPLHIACSPCGEELPRRLTDFADSAWVMEPRGNAARQWAVTTCREAGFEPDVRFESHDLLVHRRLVRTGHAVALLPSLLWEGRESEAMLLDPPGRPSRTIFTAVRAGAETRPDILAYRSALVHAYGHLSTA